MPVVRSLGSSSSPSVLLVGGSPGDHRVWGGIEDALAGDHFVRLFDPLDHGLAPDRADASLQDLEDDLLAAAESVGDAVVVGFSLGAYLAARVASRTAAVTGVVLLAGLTGADPGSISLRLALARKLEDGEVSSEMLSALALSMWLPEDEREPDAVAVINGMLADVDAERAIRGLRRLAQLGEPGREVAPFTVQGFVAHSERDVAVPLAQGRELARLAQGAKLVILDSGSHVIPLSHPAHVLGWIRTASARRG
ncbi:MAG: alpha/beta fold hydrolase [Myxococcales bacterium]|nr:alpha/beta fold hydrolase [Myxococcales bacterium]